MEYVEGTSGVSGANNVQCRMGRGYIGGFPIVLLYGPRLRRETLKLIYGSMGTFLQLHKMYAGLRDAWLYGGSAKNLFLQFCDWGIEITAILRMNRCSRCSTWNMEA